eukprot:361683_1
MTNGNKPSSPTYPTQIQPNNNNNNTNNNPPNHPTTSSNINYSHHTALPPNHPSLSSYNDISSPMTQMIALPSLSNANTNTNITHSNIPNTPSPIPIPITQPKRKRNAQQMMNEVKFMQSPQSKRQKTQHKMHVNNSRKLSLAVQQLQTFALDNGGKLPSLRYLMKLMKVGFPKAHEIIEQYGKLTGLTKEEVQTKMVLRQEKDKSQRRNKKKKKSIKKSSEDKTVTACADMTDTLSFTSTSTDENDANFLNNFICNLKTLLDLISNDSEWHIYEKNYLWNVNQLEMLLHKINDDILLRLSLEHKVRIGCAYYMIANLYYERGQCKDNNNKRNIALDYIEKALKLFKLCNTLGNKVDKYDKYEIKTDNNNNNNN